jgi:hypothetical protein
MDGSNGHGILVGNRGAISIDNHSATSISNRCAISIDNCGTRDSASVVLCWCRILDVTADGLIEGHGKQ